MVNPYNFNNLLVSLEQLGLRTLLTFLLIFVVIYSILQKTRILGEEKKRFNAVISLIIALMVVVPHALGIYPRGTDIVQIINDAIPQVSIVIIAIVMLLLIVGILGGERNWMGGSLSGWVAIAAFIAILYIFGTAAGWWMGWSWFQSYFGPDAIAIVIMLLIFAIIVWWITKDEGSDKANALSRFGKSWQDFFGGKKD